MKGWKALAELIEAIAVMWLGALAIVALGLPVALLAKLTAAVVRAVQAR